MKSQSRRRCASGLACVLLLAGSLARAAEVQIALTPAQRANAGIETVVLESIAGTPARGLSLTGRVEAAGDPDTQIVAPVAARIVEIRAAPGTPVGRGDVIVVLQGPDVAAVQRSLAETRASATAARQRLDRDRSLLAAGVISQSRMEQTESAWSTAAAQLAQAEAVLRHFTTESPSRIAARAPAAGIVTGPRHPVGDTVEAGELLAAVGTPRKLRVALAASADAARQLASGDAVTVRTRSCEVPAAIRAVGTVVDSAQTVPVEAAVDGAECLLAGEAVTAVVAPRSAAAGGWRLPARAFVRRGADTFVFVERDAAFVPVQVDSDAARTGFARAAALRQGDRVAISGTALLKGTWLSLEDG